MGSKKCTRDISEVTAVFMGSKKIYPQRCWLLLVSAGSKKCTRDVSEVAAVFMGSKKYTRNSVGCSLCLRVQKNVPAIGLVTLCVRGFKKMHPRWCLVAFRVAGLKKYTRDVSEVTAVFMG